MNIRLAWRLTDAGGNVTCGHGRWMKDSPGARHVLEKAFSSLDNGDNHPITIEKWIEEDLEGVFSEDANRSFVGKFIKFHAASAGRTSRGRVRQRSSFTLEEEAVPLLSPGSTESMASKQPQED